MALAHSRRWVGAAYYDSHRRCAAAATRVASNSTGGSPRQIPVGATSRVTTFPDLQSRPDEDWATAPPFERQHAASGMLQQHNPLPSGLQGQRLMSSGADRSLVQS